MPRSRPARCSGCAASSCWSIRTCSSPRPTPFVRSPARRTTTTPPCGGSRRDSGRSCSACSGLPPAPDGRLCDAGSDIPHNSQEDTLPGRQLARQRSSPDSAGAVGRCTNVVMPLHFCREGDCSLLFLSYRSKAASRPSLFFFLVFLADGHRGLRRYENPRCPPAKKMAGPNGEERMENNTYTHRAARCTPGSPACGPHPRCPEPLRVSGHRIQDGAR